MTAPNRNVLWGRTLVAELAASGVDTIIVAPGSRSTPLAVAAAAHTDITAVSILDERSAAFFALGRAKRTGDPVPVVTTSGTAAANLHPAVIEANQARVPMVLLTADRPPELTDSGANQTIDQEKLYGDAVRWYRTLPEPEADGRKLRMLRTTAARAVSTATGTPPGPVHLNIPFRKPLEPIEVPDDIPNGFDEDHPRAATGRAGAYVRSTGGRVTLADANRDDVARLLDESDRGLLVVGPRAIARDPVGILDLASSWEAPLLADPLSGLRFHHRSSALPVCGGYDSFLDPAVTADWPDPDVVLRVGDAPTSNRLRAYLERTQARQVLVDPAGGWREETYTATDLVACDPDWLGDALADRVSPVASAWRERFTEAESRYWDVVDEAGMHEGTFVGAAVAGAPNPATVYVSNSMPVRDLDRFGRPAATSLTVLGNRGASGIDGVTSAALGAGSGTTDPLILITGDLAFFHDLTGLLAAERAEVDCTVVLINNDGGGIFHLLPIEDFDPPFTEYFRTPHGVAFDRVASLYDVGYDRVEDLDAFATAYADALETDGTAVVEVRTDAEASHRTREAIHERVCETLG